jgi:hypothetical protein
MFLMTLNLHLVRPGRIEWAIMKHVSVAIQRIEQGEYVSSSSKVFPERLSLLYANLPDMRIHMREKLKHREHIIPRIISSRACA